MKLTTQFIKAIRKSKKDIVYKGEVIGSIQKSVSINGDAALTVHFQILKQDPKLSTNKKFKKCCECGVRNETVKRINCGYAMDTKGEIFKETICEDCEGRHCREIFKLLVNSTDEELTQEAKKSIEKNNCDVVVANDLRDIRQNNHRLLIVTKNDVNIIKKDDNIPLADKLVEKILILNSKHVLGGK
jgi:hypothetical protein